ncbi:MAG: hypothetical protein LCH37_13760, partial [Bacteroidetes bacterium]|nr:hypothetical protein [Bacteroidota bacterium]
KNFLYLMHMFGFICHNPKIRAIYIAFLVVQFKPESLVQFKPKSLVQLKPEWWYSLDRNIHFSLINYIISFST